MADSFTFRHGQRQLCLLPVDSSTVVEIGDMCYYATDDVKPASAFTWDNNLATTQAGFADVFLGIAAMKSASGETTPIDVDISPTAVYEFAVASATYEFGAKLGPDKASGNALLSQVLEAAVAASSVAVAMDRAPSATTKLKVSFASAYNPAANTGMVIG